MQPVAADLGIKNNVVHFYGWMKVMGVHQPPKQMIRRTLRNLLAVFQICNTIRREKITAVFTNTSTVNVGALAAKLMRKKHYWYIHELGEEDFGIALPKGISSVKKMNKLSEKLFSNSNFLLQKYENLVPEIKMSVLRNPVLIRNNNVKIRGFHKHDVHLLMLGQITEAKGQHSAIEALHLVKIEGYSVTLNIIGSAHDEQYLQSLYILVEKYSLQTEVYFKAHTNSPEQSIADNNILLMCSRCEAYGRVTVEAMKLGVPVIGANSGGTAEIITNGESGLIFRNNDSQSLAEAIILLITDDELRNHIISGALNRAKEVSGPEDFYAFLDSFLTA